VRGEEGFHPIDIAVFERNFRKTLETIMPHMIRRAERIGSVYLGNVEYDIVRTDTDAAYSFVFEMFDASIFFASRVVEMAINTDNRMRQKKGESTWKWLTLSRKILKDSRVNGLPVDLLLDAEETPLESEPVFVVRRNKVVHGDIRGYKEATGFFRTTDFTKPYKLPVAPSEDETFDQLVKSRRFLIEWSKSGSTHIPSGARFVDESRPV
jgi:hypothetical protein